MSRKSVLQNEWNDEVKERWHAIIDHSTSNRFCSTPSVTKIIWQSPGLKKIASAKIVKKS
jgi:hypothetical protein